MSSFPGSPRNMKGAIVGLDPFNPLASVIIFQYNPDTLTRSIRANATAGSSDTSDRSEALRLRGPPSETVTADIELDATDQLETDSFPANTLGIYPTLSALEMLLYPKAASIIANGVLSQAGFIEIAPAPAPLTLFIWGLQRIVPVRLTELTITEEAFDPGLNPLRAKVSLSMRVLTYQDLGLLSAGGALSMANHVLKEVMATLHGAGSIAASGSLSFSAGFSAG